VITITMVLLETGFFFTEIHITACTASLAPRRTFTPCRSSSISNFSQYRPYFRHLRLLLIPNTISPFSKLLSVVIIKISIDRRHSMVVAMIACCVQSIKGGHRKRILKETLTFFTLILSISFLDKVIVDYINIKNIVL
jgi:hypothetical protein